MRNMKWSVCGTAAVRCGSMNINTVGSGISVPIIGFGASLAKGAIYLARTVGFAGAFAGGLVRTAYGVGVAVVASYLVTLFFAPKSK